MTASPLELEIIYILYSMHVYVRTHARTYLKVKFNNSKHEEEFATKDVGVYLGVIVSQQHRCLATVATARMM